MRFGQIWVGLSPISRNLRVWTPDFSRFGKIWQDLAGIRGFRAESDSFREGCRALGPLGPVKN